MIFIDSIIFGENKKEYKVEKYIGGGAFGNVFKVVSEDGHIAAIKTATVEGMTGDEYEQLVNEGNLAIKVNHENVINIHYFHDGKIYPELPPYLLMDIANEGSLKDLIDVNKNESKLLELDEILSMSEGIFLGMKALNENLIHRDFHPGNVLINDSKLKISDFGLAKVIEIATRTKTFKGVQHPYYKAPESWEMKKNTIQMDMYSVGVTLYELATNTYFYNLEGKKDFYIELQEAHMYQMPKSPRQFNSNLTENYSEIVLKLLKKNPSDRYNNWDEAIKALSIENKQESNIDVSSLVSKSRATDNKIEQARIQRKHEQDLADKVTKNLEYSVGLIKSDFEKLIETFNEQTSSGNLTIKSQRNGFSIYSNSTNKSLEAMFFKANSIKVRSQDLFGRGVIEKEGKLEYKNREVLFWGYVYTEDGMGVNLLLTTVDDEDLYGSWYILTHKWNALTRTRDGRKEPFSLNDWEEFSRQVSLIQAMGVIDTTVKPYDVNELIFLVQEVL